MLYCLNASNMQNTEVMWSKWCMLKFVFCCLMYTCMHLRVCCEVYIQCTTIIFQRDFWNIQLMIVIVCICLCTHTHLLCMWYSFTRNANLSVIGWFRFSRNKLHLDAHNRSCNSLTNPRELTALMQPSRTSTHTYVTHTSDNKRWSTARLQLLVPGQFSHGSREKDENVFVSCAGTGQTLITLKVERKSCVDPAWTWTRSQQKCTNSYVAICSEICKFN